MASVSLDPAPYPPLGSASATAAVIDLGRWAASRNWVPATSGNFSTRINKTTIAITRSGPDKGSLLPRDVLVVDLDNPPAEASAEAPLHYALYREDEAIGAVVHLHSPAATRASRRAEADGAIKFSGWELQKAFAGVTTHLSTVLVPVIPNDQDTVRLARLARAARNPSPYTVLAPAYLIAGHGLYAWGADAMSARRHAEALETLLSYILEP